MTMPCLLVLQYTVPSLLKCCCPEAMCMAGSGDWMLGWQSGPAAQVPMMAVLSCPLPEGAAQPRSQPHPAPMEGECVCSHPKISIEPRNLLLLRHWQRIWNL